MQAIIDIIERLKMDYTMNREKTKQFHGIFPLSC